MQQVSLTLVREHEHADPTVVMQATGFGDDSTFDKVLALKQAYEQVRQQYVLELSEQGVLAPVIMNIMAAL